MSSNAVESAASAIPMMMNVVDSAGALMAISLAGDESKQSTIAHHDDRPRFVRQGSCAPFMVVFR